MIIYSSTIVVPDYAYLWAEAINMTVYLQNRLPNKHLLSSLTLFEYFHTQTLLISPLNPFGSQHYLHIRDEEHSSVCKYLPCPRDVMIVIYTSFPKVYRVAILEDESVLTTRDLTFPKMSSPHIATTLGRISVDLGTDLGSSP
jgi:hypothetical protein